MVTFKDGILRIEKSDDKDRFFRLPFEICLYLGFIFYFLPRTSLYYVGAVLLIAGPVIILAGRLYNKRLNNLMHTAWYLAFIIYAEVSSTWAYSPSTSALKYVKLMLVSLTICFGMTQYIDNRKDVERLLDIYLYSALTITLIEFIGTPYSRWFSGYFGGAVGGGNTNTFGFIILYAAIIGFYKAYLLHQRRWYPAVALFLFGCILSSSRKAVLMSGFGIMFILLFAYRRKHHILHFLIAVAAAAFIFTLFMKNDLLYDAIGQRLDILIKFANNEKTKYGSLQIREYYIYFAKVLFKRNPFIGQGFANFATLIVLETNAKKNYAHNNYWEILADLGIIGFVLYYWMYAYMLIKLIMTFFRNKFTYLKLTALAMLICEFILEWGVVSLYYPFYQIAIALIFICSVTDDWEDKKQFYYSNSFSDSSGGE